MKKLIVGCGCLALFGILFSPLSARASTEPADSVHFCGFDHEQLRRDHPRSAAKRPANLNVGEPRTVRIIYFLPNDWPYRAEVVDSMKTVIREARTFYRQQMQAHGYGERTFGIETDARGEPLVRRVEGRHPFSHYDNTLGNAVIAELEETYDLDANIYVVILGTDALRQGNGQPAGGVGRRHTKNGGALVVPDRFSFFTVAHELGHTFGLYHDFRDNDYIMSYGGLRRSELSACAAEFLAAHTYFNPAIPIKGDQPPAVKLISLHRYQPGTTSVPVRLQVSDQEGIHQVGLIGNEQWCRGLAGEKDAVAEFHYNGSFGQRGFLSLSDRSKHNLFIVAVDVDGNMSENWFALVETSPYEIETLRGPKDYITSVAFSPDGSRVAYGSKAEKLQRDAVVMLWNIESGENAPVIDTEWTTHVAFSPDGTLASGSSSGIKLVDVETRRAITTLSGRGPVAFSRDGTLLASIQGRDIALWDVRTRQQIGALKGHTDQINGLSFSPDGILFASGSGNGELGDDAVRLWDVASRKEVARIPVPGYGVWSVSFSPDGKTLAWGSALGGATLWDVASRSEVAFFEMGGPPVVFSPGGATLACDTGGGAISLWDVESQQKLVTLASESPDVNSMSISPDGTMLASGSWWSGTITLWDVSEWTRPRPFALEIISGDGQQGAPGAAMDDPLVVEVRDQYGNLLPEASVTFKVIDGEGKLSGRFTVEHATTDANGRVALSLTLGPDAVPNTVGVFLGERELARFVVEGIGTAVAELEGDYRTWHLPRAAAVRLGKGAIGEGDRAVAVSADGRCLAVASAIGVWLYEAATARAMALLQTDSPVHAVAFSIDGTLAAGMSNGRIELWDVETGTSIGTLRHANWGRVTAVVFSPDGKSLASGSWDQVIKLWEIDARREVGTWEVPRESNALRSLSLAFSPDGKGLISGFQDGTVRLWEVAQQMEVGKSEGHTDRVTSVSFSPDGSLLASAGGWRDPTVRLWDAATQAPLATLRGHTGEIRSVSFSLPDGGTLASGSRDGTVRLWDVATRELIDTLEDHTGAVQSVTFLHNGATLASGAANGAVLLRDVETGNVASVSGHERLSSMALTGDGVTLALGYQDGTVRLLDAETRTRIGMLEGQRSGVGSLSFSSDGALLASASVSWDNTVRLWDVENRVVVETMEGHAGGVTSVTFSPDGSLLASAGGWNDATVRLWDVRTGDPMGILEGHEKEVRTVAFSPDGALLASGGGNDDLTVKLWNVATRERMGSLEDHTGSVNSVVFSPDGRTLASGSSDGTVRLWDVARRSSAASLDNRSSVISLVFSSDGAMLASGLWGTVRLWDTETREQIATLEGHTRSVHSVAFSDDGRVLATGASDGTILLWDLLLLQRRPQTLSPVSDVEQQGSTGVALAEPIVVVVRDQNGNPVAGAVVNFKVIAGGGTLSATTGTTDADGRASTILTLGSQPGTHTVVATVRDLKPVFFTATGIAHADFDGDGTVGFSDFVQFAGKFGLSQGDEGYDARYDLDGNGAIGFSDFLIFAGAFGKS